MSIKQKLMLFHIILFVCTAFFSLNAGLNVYLIASNQPVGIDYEYLPICTENAEEKCRLCAQHADSRPVTHGYPERC